MLIGLFMALLILGAGVPLLIMSGNAKTEKGSAKGGTGLGQYSEFELFQKVPTMAKENIIYTEAAEVGGGDYLITAESTLLEDYKEYLKVLEKDGFKKVLDNGEEGLEGYVYTSHYQKDNLLVIVSHIVNLQKTTITATENTVLSNRLFYDEDAANIQGNTKTKLFIYELKSAGMGFSFQLENGHFILYDGGTKGELPYIIEHMESLVPEGEKPVIDAWFISHAHIDHMGVLNAFAQTKSYADRVCVESVYFTEPSDKAEKLQGMTDGVTSNMIFCRTAAEYLKNTKGERPDMYRPRTGERYYFGDITADIIYTPELLKEEMWDTWNASSVVMMFTIEGQKVLLTGDSDWCSQLVYTEMYDKEYFDLTVYQVPHHGINVYRQMSNRMGKIGTAVYPSKGVSGDAGEASFTGRKPQNSHLVSISEEAFAYGDGTKVLTFPYTVGTAETLQQKFVTQE